MKTAFFWVITQYVVVISYRRCGTTYQSHLQGSSLSRTNFHYSLPNSPEKGSCHLPVYTVSPEDSYFYSHRRKTLKSHMIVKITTLLLWNTSTTLPGFAPQKTAILTPLKDYSNSYNQKSLIWTPVTPHCPGTALSQQLHVGGNS
jgi:hypothetical protein